MGLKNRYIFLGILMLFTSLGYISAYYIQDKKIESLLHDKEELNYNYNEKITQLNNNVSDISDELQYCYEQLYSSEDTLNQMDLNYKKLVEDYIQLNISYQNLNQKYTLLESNYINQSESYTNITFVGENHTRILFNNVTFQYPDNMVVSISGLYEPIQTQLSGLFTGSSSNEDTIYTISWVYHADSPDLDNTLQDAYNSIKKDVLDTGLNESYTTDVFSARYITLSIEIDDQTKYMLVSTWYLSETSHHYIGVIQSDKNNVYDLFLDFVNSFHIY